MLWLLFRPLLDLWILFRKEIIYNLRDKRWKDFLLAIIPLFLIITFVVYSILWLYKDIYKFAFSERYEKVIVENYKWDIEDFFKKYEERFLAHDCWFMREVWVDELMYDKTEKSSYGPDYKCTIFDKIQRIKLFPISIWEIEKAGNKYKVRWELMRVEIVNWSPLKIAPIRFELWKTIDMDLWHFNLYWDPKNRWIESEFKNY
jgi:hypothetical protein